MCFDETLEQQEAGTSDTPVHILQSLTIKQCSLEKEQCVCVCVRGVGVTISVCEL